MGAYSYSTTASSNTSVDSIGSQGSSDAANIDNLVRALAASDAALVRDLGGAGTVSGTDTITLAPVDPTNVTAYFDGMRISFRAAGTTTVTNPTLNVDSVGAKTIKKFIGGIGESDLFIGDIKSGGTYEVVYRTAWASAAGAWELLNPSTQNTVFYGSTTSLSGDPVDLTGIPAWAQEVEVWFYNASLSAGTDFLFVQLGDSGGIEPTGYNSPLYGRYDDAGGTTISIVGGTSFAIALGNGARNFTGVMQLKRIDPAGYSWLMKTEGGISDGSNIFLTQSSGFKTLTADLTTIRIGSSGSDTFDSGSVRYVCRG